MKGFRYDEEKGSNCSRNEKRYSLSNQFLFKIPTVGPHLELIQIAGASMKFSTQTGDQTKKYKTCILTLVQEI